MSPYGSVLRQFRAQKNITLKIMAEGIGYTSSYLSAIELGGRGGPKKEVLNKTIAFLQLNEQEEHQLRIAARQSNHTVRIPKNSPPVIYKLLHMIVENEEKLSQKDLKIIECLFCQNNT